MIQKVNEGDADLFAVTMLGEFPYIKPNIEDIRVRYRKENCFVFKLVEEGETIGFLDLELEQDGKGFLAALIVLKKHRGKGHGKKLLDYALDFFKGKASEVYLIVSSKNIAAIKLYSSKGFKKKRVLEKKYLNAPIYEYSLSL